MGGFKVTFFKVTSVTFFKKLDLSVMLGASQEQYEERKNSASKYDLLDPALDVM